MKKIILILILIALVAWGGWMVYQQKTAGTDNAAQAFRGVKDGRGVQVKEAGVLNFDSASSTLMILNNTPGQAKTGLGARFSVRVSAVNRPVSLPIRAHIDLVSATSGKVLISNKVIGVGPSGLETIATTAPVTMYFSVDYTNAQLSPSQGIYKAVLRSFSWGETSSKSVEINTNTIVYEPTVRVVDVNFTRVNGVLAAQRTPNGMKYLESRFSVLVRPIHGSITSNIRAKVRLVNVTTGKVVASSTVPVEGITESGLQYISEGSTKAFDFTMVYPSNMFALPAAVYKAEIVSFDWVETFNNIPRTTDLGASPYVTNTLTYTE